MASPSTVRASAPVGAVVNITYDADAGTVVRCRDYVQTRSGRAYEVIGARQVQSRVHPNRWRLALLVLERLPEDRRLWNPVGGAPIEPLVHALVFYPRKRKQRVDGVLQRATPQR